MSVWGGETSHMRIHPSFAGIRRIRALATREELLTAEELLDLTLEIAGQTELWRPLIRYATEARWYEALLVSSALELWLIGWTPGQATPIHDHGGARGALTIATGRLVETAHAGPCLTRPRRTILDKGTRVHFPPHHIHRVANEGVVNAASIHAYSPAGLEMRLYDGSGTPQRVAAGSASDPAYATESGR
jgi:predicted metal-dependent enzyme (double-stranded beta helix superfamily)